MLSSLALLAVLTAAPPRPVVVVLYFDNQTNERDYDVLQKGLADMMVTDLVAADAVDVVEREKLQAVIGELELQRSKYFDKSTAQRVGKLVGATHAVTGAFQEVKSTLRLSVRVVELRTDKVLVSEQVSGPRDDLFELQEKLVQLLLTSMNVKLGAAPAVKSARDVDTLLSYSRAVDAADQGDFVAASARIAEVLQRAPTFELGQDFKLSLQRRMASAGDAREQQRARHRQVLLDWATQVLTSARGSVVAMADLQAARHLTARVVHAQVTALTLKAALTPRPVHNVPPGAVPRVQALVDTYVKDLQALQAELAAWRGPFRWLVDPQVKGALEALSLGPPGALWLANVGGVVLRELGAALLTGTFSLADTPFSMRPTPAEIDAARVDEAVRALDQAAVDFLAAPPKKAQPEEEVVATLDVKARGLAMLGRREAAATTWQSALDRYPQSRQFELVERHLKDSLDLTPARVAFAEAERALAKAVSGCDPKAVPQALKPVLDARFDEAGLWGVWPLVAEVEKACGRRPAFAPGLAATLELAAGYAERHQDCATFDDTLRRLAAVAADRVAAVRASHPTCVR